MAQGPRSCSAHSQNVCFAPEPDSSYFASATPVVRFTPAGVGGMLAWYSASGSSAFSRFASMAWPACRAP